MPSAAIRPSRMPTSHLKVSAAVATVPPLITASKAIMNEGPLPRDRPERMHIAFRAEELSFVRARLCCSLCRDRGAFAFIGPQDGTDRLQILATD